MKLTYLPEWQIINQSKQSFAIQEDETSISLVSPINDYAMGILSQIFFTIDQGKVVNTQVENNSKSIQVEINTSKSQILINDL